ncbi:acyl carrier protein, partial [Sporomusa ovata]
PQMQQQLCTPQMQQQLCTPQMQQQLCTPQMQPQLCTPQMQPQLCTPQMQPQLCMPQMQEQLCTPQMQPQLCTPEQLAAQQQMMMQPQMPQQSGLLKGLQYAAAPVENPVIVDINKPKLGEKVNSPEKALAIVLQSIVGRPVQESENFFAIGLTSVNVMQMITRCGEQGYQVTMQDVISNPTITELAKKLAAE